MPHLSEAPLREPAGERDVVLGLTTSTPRGGAAVVCAGKLLGELEYDGEMSHAERIVAVADALLAREGIAPSRLSAIGCDVGPGSFTGVRAAVAAAKGMAYGLGVPVVPIGSLEAVAAAAHEARPDGATAAPLAVVLDAKRSETFLAVYDGRLRVLFEPAHARNVDVWDVLDRWGRAAPLLLSGAQAERLAPWPSGWGGCVRVTAPGCDLPSARWVAILAHRRSAQRPPGPAADAPAVAPIYLRPPDAKLPPDRGGASTR